jgi:hypothetical protein
MPRSQEMQNAFKHSFFSDSCLYCFPISFSVTMNMGTPSSTNTKEREGSEGKWSPSRLADFCWAQVKEYHRREVQALS